MRGFEMPAVVSLVDFDDDEAGEECENRRSI